MVKLSTVISGNIWHTLPPLTLPPLGLLKTQTLPFFSPFFFNTQNIPSTSADQTKQRLKTRPFFKILFLDPLLSLKVILNQLKDSISYPFPSPKNSFMSQRGHQSEGSCIDQMQYSFFSSELVWPPSALIMAVSASAASSAPLASCVKQVPEEEEGRDEGQCDVLDNSLLLR